MSAEKKAAFLKCFGFTVGERDPRLNTKYAGSQMVVEATRKDLDAGEYPLPTEDGSDGPWCVVGDDLDELVATGFDYLISLSDPHNQIERKWELFAQ